jgi:hypothetical protein
MDDSDRRLPTPSLSHSSGNKVGPLREFENDLVAGDGDKQELVKDGLGTITGFVISNSVEGAAFPIITPLFGIKLSVSLDLVCFTLGPNAGTCTMVSGGSHAGWVGSPDLSASYQGGFGLLYNYNSINELGGVDQVYGIDVGVPEIDLDFSVSTSQIPVANADGTNTYTNAISSVYNKPMRILNLSAGIGPGVPWPISGHLYSGQASNKVVEVNGAPLNISISDLLLTLIN